MSDLPPEFLERLQQVTNKRARVVIDHILQHGFITTEDLTTLYGYSHPPRAAMDVRDEGIPIERFAVKDSKGRTIAAYRFPQNPSFLPAKTGGRKPFSKKLRNTIFEQADYRCAICLQRYEPRFLQVDHRVPYAILGDVTATQNTADYMPICRSILLHRFQLFSLHPKTPLTTCQSAALATALSLGHVNTVSTGKRKKTLKFAKLVIGLVQKPTPISHFTLCAEQN